MFLCYILWFICRYIRPLLVVVRNEVAVNSGSAAAKHTETIKLNLCQPFAEMKQILSITNFSPSLKAKDTYCLIKHLATASVLLVPPPVPLSKHFPYVETHLARVLCSVWQNDCEENNKMNIMRGIWVCLKLVKHIVLIVGWTVKTDLWFWHQFRPSQNWMLQWFYNCSSVSIQPCVQDLLLLCSHWRPSGMI